MSGLGILGSWIRRRVLGLSVVSILLGWASWAAGISRDKVVLDGMSIREAFAQVLEATSLLAYRPWFVWLAAGLALVILLWSELVIRAEEKALLLRALEIPNSVARVFSRNRQLTLARAAETRASAALSTYRTAIDEVRQSGPIAFDSKARLFGQLRDPLLASFREAARSLTEEAIASGRSLDLSLDAPNPNLTLIEPPPPKADTFAPRKCFDPRLNETYLIAHENKYFELMTKFSELSTHLTRAVETLDLDTQNLEKRMKRA